MNETLTTTIGRLEKELAIAKEKVRTCNHDYTQPTEAIRKIPVPHFVGYRGVGSDPEPIYEWSEQIENGWERKCELCGSTQYTNKTKPVVSGYNPDFEKQR